MFICTSWKVSNSLNALYWSNDDCSEPMLACSTQGDVIVLSGEAIIIGFYSQGLDYRERARLMSWSLSAGTRQLDFACGWKERVTHTHTHTHTHRGKELPTLPRIIHSVYVPQVHQPLGSCHGALELTNEVVQHKQERNCRLQSCMHAIYGII